LSDWPLLSQKLRNFNFFASLTLDIIWFSRNKLVHDDHQLVPAKLIIQRSSILGIHLEAWNASSIPSLWTPLGVDGIKGNFDVAVRDSFAIAVAVISDSSSNIIMVATQRLHSTDILVDEASAALLASRLALSSGHAHFIIEGDALLVILAINSPELFRLVELC
jgi:hypothetical protein